MDEKNDWFEDTWHYRDAVVLPGYLGGSADRFIVTIPYVAFTQMGIAQVDPRWLHCGVLTFQPTAERRCFTSVTSGLSNAWDVDSPDPTSISGLGIELRLDVASDEHWSRDILLRLAAMQLLIGAGRFAGARLLGDGDRVRVGVDTFGEHSEMRGLIATKMADFRLKSGTFSMIHLFSITDREREFAAEEGSDALMKLLRQETEFPISDAKRVGVV